MSDALSALRRELAQINDLSVAARVLEWDQLVMMPRGGAATRGDHLATVSRLAHELFVRELRVRVRARCRHSGRERRLGVAWSLRGEVVAHTRQQHRGQAGH